MTPTTYRSDGTDSRLSEALARQETADHRQRFSGTGWDEEAYRNWRECVDGPRKTLTWRQAVLLTSSLAYMDAAVETVLAVKTDVPEPAHLDSLNRAEWARFLAVRLASLQEKLALFVMEEGNARTVKKS